MNEKEARLIIKNGYARRESIKESEKSSLDRWVFLAPSD